MAESEVRGVGPPPYFTGKNMLRLCLARVRNSPEHFQENLKRQWHRSQRHLFQFFSTID
jgi:hypothetical protein